MKNIAIETPCWETLLAIKNIAEANSIDNHTIDNKEQCYDWEYLFLNRDKAELDMSSDDDDLEVVSLEKFIQHLTGVSQEETFYVGEYKVEFHDYGISIGCDYVDIKEISEIVRQANHGVPETRDGRKIYHDFENQTVEIYPNEDDWEDEDTPLHSISFDDARKILKKLES